MAKVLPMEETYRKIIELLSEDNSRLLQLKQINEEQQQKYRSIQNEYRGICEKLKRAEKYYADGSNIVHEFIAKMPNDDEMEEVTSLRNAADQFALRLPQKIEELKKQKNEYKKELSKSLDGSKTSASNVETFMINQESLRRFMDSDEAKKLSGDELIAFMNRFELEDGQKTFEESEIGNFFTILVSKDKTIYKSTVDEQKVIDDERVVEEELNKLSFEPFPQVELDEVHETKADDFFLQPIEIDTKEMGIPIEQTDQIQEPFAVESDVLTEEPATTISQTSDNVITPEIENNITFSPEIELIPQDEAYTLTDSVVGESLLQDNVEPMNETITETIPEPTQVVEEPILNDSKETNTLVDLDATLKEQKTTEQDSTIVALLKSIGKSEEDINICKNILDKVDEDELNLVVEIFEKADIPLEDLAIACFTFNQLEAQNYVQNRKNAEANRVDGKFEKHPVLPASLTVDEIESRIKSVRSYGIRVETDRDYSRLASSPNLGQELSDAVELYKDRFPYVVGNRQFSKIALPTSDQVEVQRRDCLRNVGEKIENKDLLMKISSISDVEAMAPDKFSRITDLLEMASLSADEIGRDYYRFGDSYVSRARVQDNLKKIVFAEGDTPIDANNILFLASTFGGIQMSEDIDYLHKRFMTKQVEVESGVAL